jgi:hypothetical protein
MSKVKNQHYVPRFYLKQWHNQTSDSQVYVYNKDSKESSCRNIKTIASSRYFYDYPNLNEEQKQVFISKVNEDTTLSFSEKEQLINNIDKQIIENALGEIEDTNSIILKSIITRLDNIEELSLDD